ncbi:MAG: hypothetical protein ACI9PP_001182 [Halobacteriales archaeon]|jgi:hypothetical protein
MQVEVAVVALIGVLADTSQFVHSNRPDVSGGALSYNAYRDSVIFPLKIEETFLPNTRSLTTAY